MVVALQALCMSSLGSAGGILVIVHLSLLCLSLTLSSGFSAMLIMLPIIISIDFFFFLLFNKAGSLFVAYR